MAPLTRAGHPSCPRQAACRLLLFGLLILSSLCEACEKVTFNVPSTLEAGTLIGRVNLKQCLRTSELVSSSDPDFIVLEDGSLYTANATVLSSEEKTFTILLKDLQDHKQKKIHVVLLSHPRKTHKTGETVLRRSKRRWAPVPSIIEENSVGPFPKQIQQLVSDTAQKYNNILYSISGPGVDQPPVGYFYIEDTTGNLFVTRPIDREEYPEFQIICNARTKDGYTPEKPLIHIIRVEDDNDNPPLFDPHTYTFCVPENSRPGTVIGQMIATDRDEPDTLHTKLKYRIVGQEPVSLRSTNMFNINPDTGSITLIIPNLDRESVDKYTLLIEVRDMGGQPFGLCSTGTAVIEIEDANDHAPMCEHSMYEVYVAENTVGAKVADISVIDKDVHGTPAWHASFNIVKGNEDGAFKIVVNPETNVGTLCVEKGLDYEKSKERRLEIAVTNDAPYSLAPNAKAISPSVCVVVVKVRDVDEGPVFDPCVYFLSIKECLPAGSLVGTYPAKDPETGNSEGIRYEIINDPCNWITINDQGQIRTTKMLDRDVPNMQFDHCNVTVSATDQSGKRGTGTVVISLLDENDNFPVIVKKDYIMCRDRKPICVTAVDADLPPNTVPFSFDIPDRMVPEWKIVPHDEKSAYLEPVGRVDFGTYRIPVRVTDAAGKGGITEITVRVCDCTVPSDCVKDKVIVPSPMRTPNVTFGIWGILALILGSLLLLLILITLCGCGAAVPVTKHPCDDLAQQNLIISNTEAPGEEVMDPNILPVKTANVGSDQGAGLNVAVKTGGQESFEMVKGGGHQTLGSVKGGGHHTLESVRGLGQGHHTLDSGRGYGQSMMDTYRYSYSEWQNFTHPHLNEKVYLCGQDEEHKHSDDYVLSYNYEGRGSPAGSVGCCTDQQEEEALDFLDHLEPKFRTLAEACTKR